MRFSRLTRSAVVLLAFGAACTQDRDTVTTPPTPPTEPGGPKQTALGVVEVTMTGIGTDQMSSKVRAVGEPSAGGGSAVLTPVASGIAIEQVSASSFIEGTRAGGGQRYISFTYRVRNGTGAPLSNVTLMAVGKASTIAGTPISSLKKFDNTDVAASVAQAVAPTGAVALGSDLVSMQALYPDVMQVYTEAEVAAITPPVGSGVTNIFPYGYVVRSKDSNANRTLPATADLNQWDGLVTLALRLPLQQPNNTADVFTITMQLLVITDSETKMTESIEEAQDTAAVRRLRDRATSLGATTVTVLNGSPALDAAVPDYPGQRQVCSPRTAGTAAAPTNTIVTPGAYSTITILTNGESFSTCSPYFRGGTASRPPTNFNFTVAAYATDRYGNVLTGIADTLRLSQAAGGPPALYSAAAPLASGMALLTVKYTDYGTSQLQAIGRRLNGSRQIPVAGVVRTWTAGAGTTSWGTDNNWSPGAVPMSLDSVYVPAAPAGGPIFPSLVQNVSIAGVTVENAGTISLNAFDMTASANVTTGTTGGITNSTGRLFLSGVAKTVEGVVPTLRVTGTYSLTANVSARAPITVDAGRLTVSALRLQASSQ